MASSPSRQPLLHPLFLSALVLLVVNDHWLKGAGILPSWLTGKLSDFAGLIVAPVVLVSLLQLKSQRARLTAHAAIALVFALTEISQPIADQLASLWHLAGISRAAFRADVTDLWALVVLPIPYALVSPEVTEKTHTFAPRVTLASALIACIATAAEPGPPHWTTRGFVVNHTSTVRDVRLSYTDASLDCPALRLRTDQLSRVVQPEIFVRSLDFQVGLDVTLPLDESEARRAARMVDAARSIRPDAGPARDAGPRPDAGVIGASTPACQLVLVHSEGFPDRIVFLDSTDTFAFVSESSSNASSLDDRALVFTDTSFEAGSALRTAEVSEDDAPSNCTASREAITFSPDVEPATRTLTALTRTPGGCFTLTLTNDSNTIETNLCGIRSELFPFAVGTLLRITQGVNSTTLEDDTGNISLTVSETRFGSLGLVLESCNGERLACGGFVVPGALGEPMIETSMDAMGQRIRTLRGRSEAVLVGLPGCETGRRAAGHHAQSVRVLDLQ